MRKSAVGVVALLLAGCGSPFSLAPVTTTGVEGSGNVVSKALPAPTGARAIDAHGALVVDVTTGAVPTLVVETDDNLVPLLTATVVGETLVLRTTGSWSSSNGFRVHVTFPELGAIAASGATTLRADALTGARATVTAAGASEVTVASVGAREVVAHASGASKVALRGSAERSAELDADGASKLDADLACPTATVKASGASDVRGVSAATAELRVFGASTVDLDVAERLAAQVSGASSVRYGGNPAVHGSPDAASTLAPR
jgi:hypothetical protein